MDYIVLEGVKPWDGRYEFDLDAQPFTTREWGWIKRHAGYMPLTVDQGWRGGDPELFAAFAVISLHRAGRISPQDVPDLFERFADVPFGATIRLEAGETAEDDAGPPPGNTNGSSNTSGDDSRTSTASPAPPPRSSGIPASATSASHPVGSAT